MSTRMMSSALTRYGVVGGYSLPCVSASGTFFAKKPSCFETFRLGGGEPHWVRGVGGPKKCCDSHVGMVGGIHFRHTHPIYSPRSQVSSMTGAIYVVGSFRGIRCSEQGRRSSLLCDVCFRHVRHNFFINHLNDGKVDYSNHHSGRVLLHDTVCTAFHGSWFPYLSCFVPRSQRSPAKDAKLRRATHASIDHVMWLRRATGLSSWQIVETSVFVWSGA